MKLVAALLVALAVTGKTEPIRLDLSPRTGFAPMTVRAKVTIEPNYLNAAMCLEYQSVTDDGDEGEFYRNCKTLDGQYAPKTFWFDVPLRVGGVYEFQASVAQGPEWKTSQAVKVEVIPRF